MAGCGDVGFVIMNAPPQSRGHMCNFSHVIVTQFTDIIALLSHRK